MLAANRTALPGKSCSCLADEGVWALCPRSTRSGAAAVPPDFEANATSVVYTEHAGGMNAYHLPHDVRRHKREAARLKALALSPEESLSTIQARLREL
ncbi:Scr1 family TA system antitoxin-like transcriptional regulator [Streptodolium elevatio]|uniref:Scr1 family TA system antitoxin-like transcriptional regulator n=1 Tax=Streptodolium elevatio TaxID=3157996 RepID=A0ABV3DHT4_9ACTN